MDPATNILVPAHGDESKTSGSDFWHLKEKPRFPLTPEEWDHPLRLPRSPTRLIVGRNDYDLVIDRRARRSVISVMRKLLLAFPTDFKKASDAFDPSEWRLLYWLNLYPISFLGGPDFNAALTLKELTEQEHERRAIPDAWLGSVNPGVNVRHDAFMKAFDLQPDVGKATWALDYASARRFKSPGVRFGGSNGISPHRIENA